jgi:hypothetical protein
VGCSAASRECGALSGLRRGHDLRLSFVVVSNASVEPPAHQIVGAAPGPRLDAVAGHRVAALGIDHGELDAPAGCAIDEGAGSSRRSPVGSVGLAGAGAVSRG